MKTRMMGWQGGVIEGGEWAGPATSILSQQLIMCSGSPPGEITPPPPPPPPRSNRELIFMVCSTAIRIRKVEGKLGPKIVRFLNQTCNFPASTGNVKRNLFPYT